MDNIRKPRDNRLVTTGKKKLFSLETKLSHSKMVFRKSTSNGNINGGANIDKQIYLGLSILKISKTRMY